MWTEFNNDLFDDGGGMSSEAIFNIRKTQCLGKEVKIESRGAKGVGSHITFLTSSNQIVGLEGGAESSNPKGKAPR
ncbi:hypothetical protein L1987_32200 [Smallanthus sonchifolius]|uniref:Uncharacterized protein n=1 Tax=Smallanthus sonchifolius TaxID=185202 RepID=A0ACB9I8B3_9ASTR|nr:hypothetical protein L1987_32200 [Smallanthus sonchifolius]